jgi:hypothetical protein
MTHRGLFSGLACVLAAAAPGMARPGERVWTDPAGDAVIRRTNTGNNGPINPAGTLPDLVRVSLASWEPLNPVADPYTGQVIPSGTGHIFRLQVVFKGLINPPGPLGIGTGGEFDPYRFGPSPVYGFLEVDIDDDIDTGGVFDAAARFRYLANVGRFGRRPLGPIGTRVANSADDYDSNFYSDPQYERSGSDFDLVLCGCGNVTVISEGGNGNGLFDPGETWIVRGRFFQRAAGYECASGAFGGSALGRYDPLVNLRFSHDADANETTITLVYALDMTGAAMLTGQSQQPVNYNAGDHTSVLEGIQDVIDHAHTLGGPCFELAHRWDGRQASQYLRPDLWGVRALFGTTFSQQQDALYVWTDTGMNETPGDLNGDGTAGASDRALVQSAIAQMDGGPRDADGTVNGSVQVVGPGPNFNIHDVTGDMFINSADVTFYCYPDCNGDGQLTLSDFGCFQTKFGLNDPYADCNRDGVVNLSDFGCFQLKFGLGCP